MCSKARDAKSSFGWFQKSLLEGFLDEWFIAMNTTSRQSTAYPIVYGYPKTSWNDTEVNENQDQPIGIEQKSTETQQSLEEFWNQRKSEEVHRHYILESSLDKAAESLGIGRQFMKTDGHQ